ncbi:hypothetical protein [Bradyrhizobium sp. SYSU BS000235]|uniref:hypothetical protein n=1 Tax=Bradyrhizobium sp. SYSU BS000235 TaxID=3411332 RepID=UPI003C70C3C8
MTRSTRDDDAAVKRLHTCGERCILRGGIRLGDFTLVHPEPIFDRAVMNPPFPRQADIDHVMHAIGFLKPGGRIVAIMSAAITFRGDTKTTRFRDLIEERRGFIKPLPTGSFKSSGTMVNTVVVSFNIEGGAA